MSVHQRPASRVGALALSICLGLLLSAGLRAQTPPSDADLPGLWLQSTLTAVNTPANARGWVVEPGTGVLRGDNDFAAGLRRRSLDELHSESAHTAHGSANNYVELQSGEHVVSVIVFKPELVHPVLAQGPSVEIKQIFRSRASYHGSFGRHMYSSFDFLVTRWLGNDSFEYVEIYDPNTGTTERFRRQLGYIAHILPIGEGEQATPMDLSDVHPEGHVYVVGDRWSDELGVERATAWRALLSPEQENLEMLANVFPDEFESFGLSVADDGSALAFVYAEDGDYTVRSSLDGEGYYRYPNEAESGNYLMAHRRQPAAAGQLPTYHSAGYSSSGQARRIVHAGNTPPGITDCAGQGEFSHINSYGDVIGMILYNGDPYPASGCGPHQLQEPVSAVGGINDFKEWVGVFAWHELQVGMFSVPWFTGATPAAIPDAARLGIAGINNHGVAVGFKEVEARQEAILVSGTSVYNLSELVVQYPAGLQSIIDSGTAINHDGFIAAQGQLDDGTYVALLLEPLSHRGGATWQPVSGPGIAHLGTTLREVRDRRLDAAPGEEVPDDFTRLEFTRSTGTKLLFEPTAVFEGANSGRRRFRLKSITDVGAGAIRFTYPAGSLRPGNWPWDAFKWTRIGDDYGYSLTATWFYPSVLSGRPVLAQVAVNHGPTFTYESVSGSNGFFRTVKRNGHESAQWPAPTAYGSGFHRVIYDRNIVGSAVRCVAQYDGAQSPSGIAGFTRSLAVGAAGSPINYARASSGHTHDVFWMGRKYRYIIDPQAASVFFYRYISSSEYVVDEQYFGWTVHLRPTRVELRDRDGQGAILTQYVHAEREGPNQRITKVSDRVGAAFLAAGNWPTVPHTEVQFALSHELVSHIWRRSPGDGSGPEDVLLEERTYLDGWRLESLREAGYAVPTAYAWTATGGGQYMLSGMQLPTGVVVQFFLTGNAATGFTLRTRASEGASGGQSCAAASTMGLMSPTIMAACLALANGQTETLSEVTTSSNGSGQISGHGQTVAINDEGQPSEPGAMKIEYLDAHRDPVTGQSMQFKLPDLLGWGDRRVKRTPLPGAPHLIKIETMADGSSVTYTYEADEVVSRVTTKNGHGDVVSDWTGQVRQTSGNYAFPRYTT